MVKEFNEIQESRILLMMKDSESIDQDGNKTLNVHWEEAMRPINFGSVVKPNQDIVRFKIEVPRKINRDDPFGFKKMFGGS